MSGYKDGRKDTAQGKKGTAACGRKDTAAQGKNACVSSGRILILSATGNAHKIKEFLEIFKDAFGGDNGPEIETVSQKAAQEISGICYEEPEETGSTFHENSLIKSEGLYAYVKSGEVLASPLSDRLSEFDYVIIIADDSGLSVDALDGAPGVHSARYASVGFAENASDADNVAKLLKVMEDVPDGRRGAHFTSSITAIVIDGRTKERLTLISGEGTLRGTITRQPVGEHGFGYDPVLFLPALGKTTAELTIDEKTAISHRGIALRKVAGEVNGFITAL